MTDVMHYPLWIQVILILQFVFVVGVMYWMDSIRRKDNGYMIKWTMPSSLLNDDIVD